jgi:hypothetical protein
MGRDRITRRRMILQGLRRAEVTRSAQAQHAADHHVPASNQRDGTHNLQRVLDEPGFESLYRRLDALGSSHQEGKRNDHQRELNDDKDNNVGEVSSVSQTSRSPTESS